MKVIPYIGIFIGLLSLSGCGNLVQEVDPGNIPTAANRLVIHSYISPQDTALIVLVETATSVLGDKSGSYSQRGPLANAVVELSDGTRSVRLPAIGSDFGLYYGINARSLPILAGGTYTLTVNAPNYSTAIARCTVPPLVQPSEIRVDSAAPQRAQQHGTVYSGRLLWQDPAGQPNFYWVTGRTYLTIVGPVGYNPKAPSRDSTFFYEYNLDFVSSPLASDQNRDGQRFISPKAEDSNRLGRYSSSDRVVDHRFVMTLSNTDENYYRYREAIDQQRTAGDNPFSEPILIPSNIQGGLGCFGAFNQASLTVRVK